MKTILLCGYRSFANDSEPIGLEVDETGLTLIDRRILELQRYGHEIITVLAGHSAEMQLRRCTRIANTELVYDDLDQQVSLVSNILSALPASDTEGAFVLPVEIPLPLESAWTLLRNEYLRQGLNSPYHILQAITSQGAPWQFGFPLLITRSGLKTMAQLKQLASLADTRLKYLGVSAEAHSHLASQQNAI